MFVGIESLHFLRPYWLLVFIPFAFIIWRLINTKHVAGNWTSVCDAQLLPHLLIGVEKKKGNWPNIIIAAVGSIAIIALSGPTWEKLPQPVFRTQSSLVIVLDLSRSMDAADIKPNRFSRAKHKVLDVLEQRKEGQTALIVYAAEPYTVTPLTQDNKTISSLVKSLTTDIMPSKGSRAGDAILQAINLLQQAGNSKGHVLLVTDGVDDDIEEAVEALLLHGYQMSVLGVGSGDGAPIPTASGGFVSDEDTGEIVIAKMDQQQLQNISQRTGGTYEKITTNDDDIHSLLGKIERLETTYSKSNTKEINMQSDVWREEGPWLLLLILPFVMWAFRRGYIVVFVVMILPLPKTADAFEWKDLWSTPDQQALQAFEKGEHKTAADLFENKEWQATAQYKLKNYQEASKVLEGLNSPNALYNQANALAKLGDLQKAIEVYDEVLAIEPEHKDAKYNRDLLEKYLEKQENPENKKDNQKQEDGDQSKQQKNNNDSENAKNNEDKNKENQSSSASENNQGDEQSPNKPDSKNEQASKDKKEEERAANEQQQKDKTTDMTEKKDDENNADDSKIDHASESKMSEEENEQDEKKIAREQWLKQIPDDPGGLLRRKFEYQSQLNQQINTDNGGRREIKPW